MSRVLVTGGAGAIGSNLVRALLARGDEVLVFDDLSSGRAALVPDGAELLIGSVADQAAVAEAFAWGPEAVAHLAARFANQSSVDDPEDDLVVNGLGTLRVLEAAAGRARKVLVCSSSCVYGHGAADDAAPVPLAHDTPYAMTKAISEGYARFFAADRGLDTIVVRPFNVYGPGEHPGPYRNVIPNWFRLAARGEPLRITGTGDETRDFTFVTDAVRGMIAALDAPTAPGAAYNIASGVETRIGDLAQRVLAITGSEAGVDVVGRRSWDLTARRLGRIDRARVDLGYEPRTTLDEGLAETWRWLQAHADLTDDPHRDHADVPH